MSSLKCTETELLKYDLSESTIWQRISTASRYPVSLFLEITHQCNLRCPHCCVAPHGDSVELTYSEIVNLFDQFIEMGGLVLTISGGEPTMRNDLIEIINAAVERRLVVLLKTNAVRLTEDDARKMAECGLYELNPSLYHTCPEKHDRFVGRAGAWNRTVAAMRAFKKAGRNVRASIMVMNWNIDAVIGLEQMCVDEGWRSTLDFRIALRRDGAREPVGYRTNPEKLIKTIERSAFLRHAMSKREQAPPSVNSTFCGIKNSLVIQPEGTVIPCVSLIGYILGNVRKNRLADIWRDSEDRRKAIPLRWGDSPHCVSCDLISDCHRCPANGFIEHGNFTTPSAYDCELAKVWREARLRLKKDDG